jgi:preprotein translocase subunit SecG
MGVVLHILPLMIFAAINWLSISINLLLVIFVIVCLLMSLLILMQRPKQEGLGAAFGGGVTDQVFGARTTNVLQRGTVYLGSLFFIISMTLAILIGKQTKTKSLLESEKVVAEKSADKQETPTAGEIPKSLVDELSSGEQPATPPTEETAPPTEETTPPTEEAAPDTPSENAADKPK